MKGPATIEHFTKTYTEKRRDKRFAGGIRQIPKTYSFWRIVRDGQMVTDQLFGPGPGHEYPAQAFADGYNLAMNSPRTLMETFTA